MKTTIKKSKTAAIKYAKQSLKNSFNVNRMSFFIHSRLSTYGTSCNCDCGETETITITGSTKLFSGNITVGICKQCGEN